jgi:lipopolysaccharide transport system permease protein
VKTVRVLTLASLKSRYRNTWGGFFWVHFNPLITYAVHCFIFSKILRLNMPNISLFLLGGVLPWSFFSSSVESASGALISSRDLIRSYSVSPLVITTAMVIENFVNFLISFTFLTIILFFTNNFPLNGFVYLPFAMLSFFLFTLFSCISLSILNVFYRDVRFITSFVLNILFFITPILYPESFIPNHLKWITIFNPIYKVILPIRSCIYEFNSPANLENSIWALSTIVISLLMTLFIWKKFRNELIQKL